MAGGARNPAGGAAASGAKAPVPASARPWAPAPSSVAAPAAVAAPALPAAPAVAAAALAPARLRLRPREDAGAGAELNMTSMTDVIFILLVFFIALSEVRASQVRLDVPEVSDEPAGSEDSVPPSAVEIAKDGKVFLEGREVPLERLVDEVRALAARDGRDPRVRIRGDREGQFGVFAQVIAGLTQAKITEIEIEVQSAR